MQRIRAARAIAEHFQRADPESGVTENMIRRLMAAGELPTIQNGSKKLTSIEAVEKWLDDRLNH